jgi:hypothetical protein
MPKGEPGQWTSDQARVPGSLLLVNRKTMASIRKFEDVEAWQKARGLTREIFRGTNYLKQGQAQQLYDLAGHTSHLLSGFIRCPKSHQSTGGKR